MMLGANTQGLPVPTRPPVEVPPLCPAGYQQGSFSDGLSNALKSIANEPQFIPMYMIAAPLKVFDVATRRQTGGSIIDGPTGAKCANPPSFGETLGFATPSLLVIGGIAYWLVGRQK